ncbi:MAG TPA: DUF2339 domain-containing protein [Stellaceae bacterium]
MSDIGLGDFFNVLIAAVLIIPLSALILAIWAITANRGLRRRIDELTAKMRMVDHRVIRLGEAVAGQAAPEALPLPSEAAAPPSPVVSEPPVVARAEPEPEKEPVVGEGDRSEPTPAPPSTTPPATPGRSWEQVLAENWLVWLGGATLAMGGAFLVKLSIDYGLLTPAVRVAAAILLGIGLAVGADLLARREGSSSYVSQALAAAGAAIVFAALYAAYQLYGLIPAPLVFPLLAATAGATLLMSLRHGPYVAALGLAGAYAVPLLVARDHPHATPLFIYLTVVTAAVLALLRHRAWWWLAWPSLAAAVFWTLLWLTESANLEAPVVAVYLLAQYGLFAAFRRGIDRVGFLAGVTDSPQVRVLTRIAFWALALPLLVLVQLDDGTASLIAAFTVAAFVLWFAWRDPALDDVIGVAGTLLVLILASWELPLGAAPTDFGLYGRPPVQITSFLTTAIAAAALLGGGCWAMLGRVARPGRWAMLSAAAPKTILIVAYWRLHTLLPDLGWSAIALVLAALALSAVAGVARNRDGNPETETAIAAYATSVLAGTILAAVFALSTAVLSVALALHLPAMGWIDGRVRAPILRRLALGVAIAVLVRLVLNPYVIDYPLSATPIVNWLLYGYGVPALAFIVATRQFGSRADDLTTAVLEAGSIVFTTALLTLELRHALTGHIATPLAHLGRDSSNALLWLALSGGLLWLGARKARPVLIGGGIALFAAATVQIVLWQMLIANPLVTGQPVGAAPLLDALAMAYLLPAIAYTVIARRRLGPDPVQWAARLLACALSLLWLSLEIRHAFRGENLIWGVCGEGEWYAYSAAWLAYAAIALGFGLYWRAEWLRRVALAGIGLVALKVFVSDMAELTGILRALSFMGLGAVLIGIGYAYRRLQPVGDRVMVPE